MQTIELTATVEDTAVYFARKADLGRELTDEEFDALPVATYKIVAEWRYDADTEGVEVHSAKWTREGEGGADSGDLTTNRDGWWMGTPLLAYVHDKIIAQGWR